jgi:hypothetical protein
MTRLQITARLPADMVDRQVEHGPDSDRAELAALRAPYRPGRQRPGSLVGLPPGLVAGGSPLDACLPYAVRWVRHGPDEGPHMVHRPAHRGGAEEIERESCPGDRRPAP